jgi:hypothetical protein
VSQNVEIVKNRELFRSGAIHRYLRTDQYVAKTAFISIGFSLLGYVLASLPLPLTLSIGKIQWSTDHSHWLISFLSAISFTLLADCFISVLQYYLVRIESVFENTMARSLLDKKWEDQNNASKD